MPVSSWLYLGLGVCGAGGLEGGGRVRGGNPSGNRPPYCQQQVGRATGREMQE